MYEQHVLNALKNIDEVKKFFTSYSSAHLLINSTRPNIFGLDDTIERLEKIRGNSITFGGIRMLDRPPCIMK
ncbi:MULTISPECIES: hypothetical protein [Psychrilyobacter]|uniref:Uncharacterized protein n=1 Tax=Psychrilyobacter piezotolerans TaxID=2293438 RepID=A0ABX9KCS0_9FUSO|nr:MULTISPECIES: hypothetical protein [Psychrilyobacter]MCS5423204.1 hypothetical protein [Psychrilyobacter sp. S5]NDI77874.1 hypothetical protein [Psychrilyobacter piezotolerans]RDE58771.1 hypothetical protein DV867_15550 [Psychrilyobacter sp. S5]REI39245.1 hypothetical protein DYH56_15550 [Psychrilyobacter piezotolerans]